MPLFTTFIKELLFPATCIICNHGSSMLCETCRCKIPLAPSACPFCSTITSYGTTCARCAKKHELAGAVSVFDYSHPSAKKLIDALKFQGLFDCLTALQEDALACFSVVAERLQPDAIVPVPISRQSFLERGYNQTSYLAHRIGKAYTVPVIEPLKNGSTRRQHTLGAEERWKCMAAAIQCGKLAKRIERVIVIDDILTTGATLDACARALRLRGAKAVWGFTLCRQLKIS